jgi:hypothetical protein
MRPSIHATASSQNRGAFHSKPRAAAWGPHSSRQPSAAPTVCRHPLTIASTLLDTAPAFGSGLFSSGSHGQPGLTWCLVYCGGTGGSHGGAPVSLTARAVQAQALVEYVLLFSGVIIVCVIVLAVIGQAIPWSKIVDGFHLLP